MEVKKRLRSVTNSLNACNLIGLTNDWFNFFKFSILFLKMKISKK